MPLKKILFILIIILIIVICIFVAYNFLIKKDTESPSETGQEPTAGTETPAQISDDIQIISQEPVIGAAIDGRKVKYYSVNNGNVYQSNLDGSDLNRISSTNLLGLVKVLWSPSKNKVISIFEENGLIKKYSYDYLTQSATPLYQEIRWITWAPDQDKIAYQYYNSQNEDNNISIADPDGSNWQNIFQTRMKDLIVEWPAPDKISIRTKPSGLVQSVIYTMGLNGDNFEKVINQAYGLSVLWSPLGNKLLFSETNSQGKNLKLKIADFEKSTISELNLATLPEKCAWGQDNRTIFCAIPKNIPDSAVLPDDYYKEKIYFSDDIWRINLDTEETVKIFGGGDNIEYDAKELLLPSIEDYLIFTNQRDGLLYSLKL